MANRFTNGCPKTEVVVVHFELFKKENGVVFRETIYIDLRHGCRSQSFLRRTLDDRGSTSAHWGRRACQAHPTRDWLPRVRKMDSAVQPPPQHSHPS